jgi:glycosyltransferase involved in cell wall biosynthesis
VTKLAFVIPSWNRPKQLEICVESIAGQVRPEDDVRVIVIDDASDHKDMPNVLLRLSAQYQCVEIRHKERSQDYSDAFRTMFRAAPDAEWVWTFGDDDKLRPKALSFVLSDLLPRMAERRFLHITEATRTAGTNSVTGAERLIDLCCTFGWIEMTGFITGNITRGEDLAHAAETPRWRRYASSSFVQSAALLEMLRDAPCAFVDIPLIATQDNETSPDTAERWAQMGIGARYLNSVDALEAMFDDGVLVDKLPTKFFRYLNINLWDRFLVHFLNDCINQKAIWPSEAWDRVARFAKLLADDADSKKLLDDVEAARGMTTLWLYMNQNLDLLRGQIAELGERRSASVYPYSFIEQATPVA